MTPWVSRVLQVGDVAGVGAELTAALSETHGMDVSQVSVSEFAAGSEVFVRALTWPLRGFSTHERVRRAARSFRPDIIHLHWARYAPFVQTNHVPLVVHAHGSDVRGRADSIAGLLVQRSLRRAALVLASTPDLLSELPRGAIYLPNPIDTEFFAPPADDSNSGQRVFIHSRLSDVKGADTIVDAVRRIHESRPALEIAGFRSGSRYDDRAEEIGVRLLPPADRAGVVRALQAATVVIGQQRIGTLGLSELEAMACGRPVLASLRAGRYESAPPVINVTSSKELAEACIALLDDPHHCESLGRQARDYVMIHHERAMVASRLVELYSEIGARG